ncbi:hypothetical protein B5X24_HaOG207828 [Helicoverpa armigera]|uniref:Uncharacterized protein n=1 Tax=Helicoverpa armigera TaxID=29058 RepID=A0A2W1BJI6_HELAM|nr:hypothetical protein B5X24_HaOG207828 [Helicoverpa armigera]
MDKNTYETYEFLPTNSSEAETDQFFVVQDDGTFLLNRQIQYVAQVQDVKEVLDDVQPCTVYGVSSQQFFVDVDNSAELISVSDQFILPDGDNGLYTNSYLLQPSSSSTTEQMDEDVVVDQFKPAITQNVDIDVVSHDSKQGNNFTEITLSDEQYQTLEQKGWILLESNDKIFVLNTLGLHDITTNDKLIQKLKNEIQNGHNNVGNNEGTLKIESYSSQFPNIVTEPLSNQQETVEFVINADSETNDTIDSVQFIVDNKENIQATSVANEVSDTASEKHEPPKLLLTETSERIKQAIQLNKDTSSIKIKTKFNFKADTVVSQLLKVPNLRDSMVGHNLIITKFTSNKDEFGTIYNRSKVTLVTGRVKEKDDTSSFEHIPNLLHTIKINAEKNVIQPDEVFTCIEEKVAREKFTVFHVHIIETKCFDNVIRVSVTLNKRRSMHGYR